MFIYVFLSTVSLCNIYTHSSTSYQLLYILHHLSSTITHLSAHHELQIGGFRVSEMRGLFFWKHKTEIKPAK